MSWLTEVLRPKIRTLFASREVPDNLWHQCPNCQQMTLVRSGACAKCDTCGETSGCG